MTIHGRRYKTSQFADDTTLILGSLKELKAANKAIKRWCDATGMREYIKNEKVWRWASIDPLDSPTESSGRRKAVGASHWESRYRERPQRRKMVVRENQRSPSESEAMDGTVLEQLLRKKPNSTSDVLRPSKILAIFVT